MGCSKYRSSKFSGVLSALLCVSVLISSSISVGYKQAGKGNDLPINIDTVAVPVFENGTMRPELGRIMADALIREIQKRNRIKLTGIKNADAVVRGFVRSYDESATAFDENGFAVSYHASIVVDVILERKGNEVVKFTGLERSDDYNTSGSPLDNNIQRRQAAVAIAEDVMEFAQRNLFQGF